jgi:hypothetical protein
MPLNFYDNQGLYVAANKGKSISLVIEIDKTSLAGMLHLIKWLSMVKIQPETLEPIKDQQQVELRRGKTFSPTHRSHQAKSPYLMIHLLHLLLPLLISMTL